MLSKEVCSSIVSDFVMKENVTEIEWNGHKVNVNYITPPAVADAIVVGACSAAYINDEYHPLLKELAKRSLIIATYTNVDLPENAEEKNAILYGTDLFDVVCAEINQEQLHAIFSAIEETIKLRNMLNMSAIQRQTLMLFGKVSTLSEKLESMMDGITDMDLTNFVKAVSNSKLDEEKLVSAIVSNTKEEK